MNGMKQFLFRVARLIAGLFLYSLGIVFTIQANIGYAPWDVFHAGLVKTIGVTMGMASIFVGFAIVIIVVLLGEKIGLGTVLNMLLIGAFLDMILMPSIIPLAAGFVSGVFMLAVGLFIIAFASYLYISSGFGAGPRDSLMVAITRKTKLPVGVCRAVIETAAVVIGWFLGGMAGVGTIISAFGIGFCIQIVFRLLKFDVAAIMHETILQTIRAFLTAIRRKSRN